MSDAHQPPQERAGRLYGRAVDGFTAKICEHIGYDGVAVDLGEVVALLSGRQTAETSISWTDIVRHVQYISDAVSTPVAATAPDTPECRRAATELASSVEIWENGAWLPAASVLGDESGTYPVRLERLRASETRDEVVVDGPHLSDLVDSLNNDLRDFASGAQGVDAPRNEGRFDLLTTVLGLPQIYQMETMYADEARS